jgi:Transposase and inactivated derivatives, IS30 family
MSHYHHLSISEREKILIQYTKGKSLRLISREMGRSTSTITREIKRNCGSNESYSAIEAQKRYDKRRKKCRRPKILSDEQMKKTVMHLFLDLQWSPEQISNRLVYENSIFRISYATIYRAIYTGMLNTRNQKSSKGNQDTIRNLRHKGKSRRIKGTVETRGKIVISNRIQERPKEADERQVIGHWEADTVAGKMGAACLVTMADRCSRYLLAEKVAKKHSALVADKMIELLSAIPRRKCKSITPDRGKEFSKHLDVTQAMNGLQFYFSDPHSPWQRGTNENTNGLLRQYIPKYSDISLVSEDEIALFVNKMNFRPRKCLGWLSPHEVFFNLLLHLT